MSPIELPSFPLRIPVEGNRRAFRLFGLPEGAIIIRKNVEVVKRFDPYDVVPPWFDIGFGYVFSDQPLALTGGGIIQVAIREVYAPAEDFMQAVDFAMMVQSDTTGVHGLLFENVNVIRGPIDTYIPENRSDPLRFEYASARWIQ